MAVFSLHFPLGFDNLALGFLSVALSAKVDLAGVERCDNA